jgi:CheY-like chemotaxis protein
MDCQMPVMSGFEATSKVRQREHELGLPPQQIIAFTAHGRPEDLDHCYQAGMNEVLLKPVRLDTMRELIERRIAP